MKQSTIRSICLSFGFAAIMTVLCAPIDSANAQRISHEVDGFRVTFIGLPTKARFPFPTDIGGQAFYLLGTNYDGGSGGVDPFYMVPGLENVSPYLFLQANSSAVFALSSPATVLHILWGSPDPANSITFYNASGQAIGTLYGADVQKAFGFSEATRPFPVGYDFNATIEFPSAFSSITFINGSGGCCFEFSNVGTN